MRKKHRTPLKATCTQRQREHNQRPSTATHSSPSTQQGSLMGCLMGPSSANGTLVVILERPGKAFSLGACGGEYSTSAIFHSDTQT